MFFFETQCIFADSVTAITASEKVQLTRIGSSPAAKSKSISLCGEIMKLGTLIGDPCKIIFRLGPNSETPPGGRHLEF